VRKKLLVPSLRLRTAGDDSFIVTLGAQAFARWSVDPARTIRRMLAVERSTTLVADLQDQPVGFVIVDVAPLGRPYGPWASPSVARIDAIAVVPRARVQGVGSQLVAAAEELARKEGAVVMTLMTATRNMNGRRLFDSAGFIEFMTSADSYANGDDAELMFKSIA